MQTWTCTKCQNVNPTSECKCLREGCDGTPWKPAGLSDMGMEALEAFNAGRRAIHAVEYAPASFRSAEVTRTEAFAFWKAARAPLEAENKTLRERIEGLESENRQLERNIEEARRTGSEWWQWAFQIVGHSGSGPDLRKEISRELAQAQKPGVPIVRMVVGIDRGDDVDQTAYTEMVQGPDGKLTITKSLVGLEAEAEIARHEVLQKPAPAGLPEVVSVRVLTGVYAGSWHKGRIEDEVDRGSFNVRFLEGPFANQCVLRKLDGEGDTWRRIPPAQTSREPRKCSHSQGHNMDDSGTRTCVACGEVLNIAAPPPGEVSAPTPNLWAWEQHEELGSSIRRPWVDLEKAVEADIRAAVERESAKDKARIAELANAYQQLAENGTRQQGKLMQERDAALAEVERLKAWKESAIKAAMEWEQVCREVDADGSARLGQAYPDLAARLLRERKAEIERLRGELERAKAQPERKVPKVGDKVWTVAVGIDGITPAQGCEPREDTVTDDGFMTEHRQYPRRVCDLGKTWWWDDPGAKGEG